MFSNIFNLSFIFSILKPAGKKLTSIYPFFLITLSGCAAHVFDVKLMPPETDTTFVDVKVQDVRLDPQVYMTGISMGSTASIYLLTPEPPLDISLQKFIQAKSPPSVAGFGLSVRIERLDLKNKVGFVKADELYCEIESTVTQKKQNQVILVKTYSKNTDNFSSLVTTSARVILRQCLEQHGQEILQQFMRASNDH